MVAWNWSNNLSLWKIVETRLAGHPEGGEEISNADVLSSHVFQLD